MEKQPKFIKNKILQILPKAAMTFQNNLPFSPGRDHKRSKNASKWLKQHGGLTVSIIPDEARRKSKGGGSNNNIDYQEPTSPKVSCMGQIKHKKKQIKKAKAVNKSMSMPIKEAPVIKREVEVVVDETSTFRRMFLGGRKSDAAAATTTTSYNNNKKKGIKTPSSLPDKPPRLSEMKRFASGRDSLTDFDWKAKEMDYFCDHYNESDAEEDEDEEEVIIPFSAPILLVGGDSVNGGTVPLKPRKEINLWKRRTMAPPRPLQLNPSFRAS